MGNGVRRCLCESLGGCLTAAGWLLAWDRTSAFKVGKEVEWLFRSTGSPFLRGWQVFPRDPAEFHLSFLGQSCMSFCHSWKHNAAAWVLVGHMATENEAGILPAGRRGKGIQSRWPTAFILRTILGAKVLCLASSPFLPCPFLTSNWLEIFFPFWVNVN